MAIKNKYVQVGTSPTKIMSVGDTADGASIYFQVGATQSCFIGGSTVSAAVGNDLGYQINPGNNRLMIGGQDLWAVAETAPVDLVLLFIAPPYNGVVR